MTGWSSSARPGQDDAGSNPHSAKVPSPTCRDEPGRFGSRQAAEGADRTAAGLRRDRRLIMDTLGIGLLDPQYSRSDMLDKNPMVWMLQVDGLVGDAR